MSPRRRRSRSGFPIAVAIAILVAIFASRSAYTAQIAQAEARRAAKAAPTLAVDGAVTSTPAAAPERASGRGASRGFASRQGLLDHFEKHGSEFPGLDMAAYLRAAQSLRDAPATGTILELRRADGVLTRFDKASGAFIAVNRDGTIRTFFRPNDGERYFRRQAARPPARAP